MSEDETMKTNERRCFDSVLVAAAGLTFLIAGGCMVGPNYRAPQQAIPSEWAGVAKTAPAQPSVVTARPVELSQWWRQFNDPALTALVEEALGANLDLKIAEARLRQSRASQGVTVGGLWPALTASGSYQRTQKGGAAQQDLFQAGLDALWELDLFGGRRRNVEAAEAAIQAAIEGIRDVQVSIAAEVALDYFQLRSNQQQILIAQNNLKAQQQTAEITRKRLSVGFASALDVANADANVATTGAQIPVFESAAQQAIYALSVLLARPPADLLQKLAPAGSLPGVPAQVPAGIPSELLRRRPDIRAAEAQLHAATAQIGVAVADFFPKFSLTGSLNWSSNLLHSWWNDASRSISIGPAVTWPIFQGGAIMSNVRLQEALRDQAFLTYQKTVLAAFQDVENALIAFAREQQHRQQLSDAVAANRKAVELSLQLYAEGLTDFLNVLNAQRSLYASEDALLQSERSITTDLIALYKALGGGWESMPRRLQPPLLQMLLRRQNANLVFRMIPLKKNHPGTE